MLKVYGDTRSGNCYKVKLLLRQLDRPFEWVAMDILSGDTRKPEYLAKNANGKIPLLEIEPGNYLPESGAILNYLADGTEFLPVDSLERARVLQWQFFEQYSHEPYIAVARFIVLYLRSPADRREELAAKLPRGYAALAVMEDHLKDRELFVGERYGIADISLYAYTHVAHEGGFSLDEYPAVRGWLDRVRSQPGYVSMDG